MEVRVAGIALVAVVGVAQAGDAQVSPAPARDSCFRARPALTYSSSGIPERGDTTWAFIGLHANGRVSRPLLPQRHSMSSTWRMDGDTLRLRVSDWLVGWDVVAVADSAGYTGTATYLTDVVTADWKPPRIPVRLERTGCPDDVRR